MSHQIIDKGVIIYAPKTTQFEEGFFLKKKVNRTV